MNLLHSPWIPVRRASGRRERVAPWQLTENLRRDPIHHLAAPRPDFDGALAQLWIGLLQTAFAPEDERSWRERWRQPPPPEELRASFEPLAGAFELFGEGPRFFQDLTLGDDGEVLPIERLLLERLTAPGTDHFAKLGVIESLCPPCAASALMTAQVNSPSGGRGYRTGLRGGAPLTTLAWSDAGLWHGLWLNVLPRQRFQELAGDPQLSRPEDTFPWLAPTRTSEKGTGRDTTALEVHPAQMFFAMPRRVRLRMDHDSPATACDLCGEPGQPPVTGFLTKNLGVNYVGAWRHPLSPYRRSLDGTPLALKGNHSLISYEHYLGLVLSDESAGTEPAVVVHRASQIQAPDKELKIWAFGFEVPPLQAKTTAWCDGTMPLWTLDPEIRRYFADEVARWVRTARLAASELTYAVKMLFARRPKDVKGSLEGVQVRFWGETEADFYAAGSRLRGIVNDLAATEELKRAWLATLRQAARRIFEDTAQAGYFQGSDPRQVASAWRSLDFKLSPYNKKLQAALGLTPPPPAAAADQRKARIGKRSKENGRTTAQT